MSGKVNLKLDVPDVWKAHTVQHTPPYKSGTAYVVAKAGQVPLLSVSSEAKAKAVAKALSICAALGFDVEEEIEATICDRFLQAKVTFAGTPGPITLKEGWDGAWTFTYTFEDYYHSHVSCTGKGRDLVVVFHNRDAAFAAYKWLVTDDFGMFRLPNGHAHTWDRLRPATLSGETLTIPIV